MRALLLALVLVLPAAAQPGLEDAVTDGTPMDYDDPATLERMLAVADDITGQGVHDCVADITADPVTAYRMMGTPTQDAFLQKHQDVFADLGMPSALHHFDEGSAAFGAGGAAFGQGGTNLLGVLPGRQADKWVVLGGHYDTREGTVGALDNGSGICSVLEIARALKADVDANGPYEASVVFAWYDGEEWGLYGASAFAEDPSVGKGLLGLEEDAPVDILVSQSYDMPGLNYPARNVWAQYGEPVDPDAQAVLHLRTAPIHDEQTWTCWSYGCYEELKSRPDFQRLLHNFTNHQFLVREVAYDLLAYPPEHVWVHDDHYGRSDHIPLIARGAAGMRIQGSHDEQYPCYHQPCDTLEWLYIQAGSKEELVEAYDAEASIGGTVAAYMALRGGHGPYGEPFWADKHGLDLETVLEGHGIGPAPQEGPAGAAIPAPGVLVLVALVALALRRRW